MGNSFAATASIRRIGGIEKDTKTYDCETLLDGQHARHL